jgi:hypothetical protein
MIDTIIFDAEGIVIDTEVDLGQGAGDFSAAQGLCL